MALNIWGWFVKCAVCSCLFCFVTISIFLSHLTTIETIYLIRTIIICCSLFHHTLSVSHFFHRSHIFFISFWGDGQRLNRLYWIVRLYTTVLYVSCWIKTTVVCLWAIFSVEMSSWMGFFWFSWWIYIGSRKWKALI
jgi:hypothetical protein